MSKGMDRGVGLEVSSKGGALSRPRGQQSTADRSLDCGSALRVHEFRRTNNIHKAQF